MNIYKPLLNIKGAGSRGKHSDETKEKVRASKTGVKRGPLPEEDKAKISAALKGRIITWGVKISQAKKGHSVHTAESKAKMSATRTGVIQSQATKEKRAMTHRGMTRSIEARRNMSAAQKRRWAAAREAHP